MAELADAYDSGSYRSNSVEVQVLLPAPKYSNPNLLPIGKVFGFVVFLKILNNLCLWQYRVSRSVLPLLRFKEFSHINPYYFCRVLYTVLCRNGVAQNAFSTEHIFVAQKWKLCYNPIVLTLTGVLL